MSVLLLPVTGPPVASAPPGPSGRSAEGSPAGEGFADCLGQAQSDSTKARTATAEGQTQETPVPPEPVAGEDAQDAPVAAATPVAPVSPAEVVAVQPVLVTPLPAAPAAASAADAGSVVVVPASETAAPAAAVPLMDSPLPPTAHGANGDTPAAAGEAAAQLLPDESLGRFVAAAAHEAHAQRAALKDVAPVAVPVTPLAAALLAAAPVAEAPVVAVPADVAGAAVAAPVIAEVPATEVQAEAPAPDAGGPQARTGVAQDGAEQQAGREGPSQHAPQVQLRADAKPASDAKPATEDSPLAATARADAAPASAAPQAVMPREELPKATPVPLQRAAAAANELLQVAVRRNVTHARLQLSPAELGGIEVRLSYTSAGVTAQLIADAPQAAQVLERAAQDLRNALERADQTVLALDVSTRDQHQARAGGAFAGFGDPGSGPGGPGTGRGSRAEREVAAEAPTHVRTLSLSTGVVVDVLA